MRISKLLWIGLACGNKSTHPPPATHGAPPTFHRQRTCVRRQPASDATRWLASKRLMIHHPASGRLSGDHAAGGEPADRELWFLAIETIQLLRSAPNGFARAERSHARK